MILIPINSEATCGVRLYNFIYKDKVLVIYGFYRGQIGEVKSIYKYKKYNHNTCIATHYKLNNGLVVDSDFLIKISPQ